MNQVNLSSVSALDKAEGKEKLQLRPSEVQVDLSVLDTPISYAPLIDGKKFIYDVSLEEMRQWMSEKGEKAFRATQVRAWLPRGVAHVDELTDIAKNLREELAKSFDFTGLQLNQVFRSKLDATCKYVFTLSDGNGVESVYMEYKHGTSVCLSSQAGCRMGCKFCASTGLGFVRNLSAGELYAQVARIARDQKKRIDNIVVMGIGEPLENYTELMKFLRMIHDPKGLNIGLRHVTVSTCGLVPQIIRLANEQVPITLAISLHAPKEEIRRSLMPIAYRFSLEQLLEAAHYYVDTTGRRITFEYAMFKEVNDSPELARELAKLLKGLHCHINLIPANEFAESEYKRSTTKATLNFQAILQAKGFSCTIRRELGSDISAACGQLRRRLKL